MEHITVIELSDGYKKLVAEDGYRLYNTINKQYYSEAVIKNCKGFVAVKIK